MSTPTLKIAIVGAGPVGLTLAAILHRNGIQSTVFERESSATARAQGGTLDVHGETGQRAIVAAGLLAEFRGKARAEGEATRLVRKDGTDEGRGRPEIDRRDLRDLLIKALPADCIRWGRGVAAVTPVPGTRRWGIDFVGRDCSSSSPDHERGPYDLVVGADGAWSRVRHRLTHVGPLYSGVTQLDLHISSERLAGRPDVAAFVGSGSCMMADEDRFVALQRHGDGGARAYACVRTSRALGAEVPSARAMLELGEDDGGEVDWTDGETRKRFMDRQFGGWVPEVVDMVLAMTEQPLLRPLYMLPVGHRWDGRAGLSLVGDAAHLMTPFAGVGVNVGMVDALELAQGIVGYVKGQGGEDEDELARVVRRYEEGMFERSSRDAAFTAEMMEMEFKSDGLQRIKEVMTGGALPE
ncbi:FAD/NAD(P)-binding domain-containing protein [Jackrogersella minutella]|nr:FAD/NAD(P)-binding domain-containing protein [Jackrogersella minutella]